MDCERENADAARNITVYGMLLNLLLVAVKFCIGICYSSQSLVADAVHSMSDCVTDIAVLVGVRFWSEPADLRHPHGHKRIEALVTLFIGAALAVVAVMLASKAVCSLGSRETHVPPTWPVFAAALISIVTKEILYRRTAAIGRRCNSAALIANAWHHRSDALSSIPVAVAVVAGKLWPGLTHIDACAALIVAAMLLHASWNIAWPSLRELADEGADGELLAKIIAVAASIPGVREISNIRTRRIGGGYTLDLHILVDGDMRVADGHRICEEVHDVITGKIPEVKEVLSHLEPLQDDRLEEKITALAVSVPGVDSVHHIRLRRVLSGYDVDLHVLVDSSLTVREGHRICDEVTLKLIASGNGIMKVLTHLEPSENKI